MDPERDHRIVFGGNRLHCLLRGNERGQLGRQCLSLARFIVYIIEHGASCGVSIEAQSHWESVCYVSITGIAGFGVFEFLLSIIQAGFDLSMDMMINGTKNE